MSSNNNTDNQQQQHHHTEGGDASHLASPSQMSSVHAGFSPEDIQELLGGVLDDHPHEHEEHQSHEEQAATTSCDSNHDGITDDVKAAARSERKRSREKQRRSDVNKQFATLTDLLRQIESSHTDLFASPVWTEASFSPSNRVELMARTIHVLQTMEHSHKRQKTRIQELEVQLDSAKKAGEEAAAKAKEKMMAPMQAGQNQVVMMVPMLIGGHQAAAATTGSAMAPGPAAAAPTPMAYMMPTAAGPPGEAPGMAMPGMAGAMPWMMPNPMSPWGMPMAAATAAVPTAQPVVAPAASAGTQEETKQPASSSDNTATSNLAHCA